MATLSPYVNEAEQLYVIDLLGKEFYAEFLPLYTASVSETPTPLSPANAALLTYIQRCLAYYTQLLAIPHLAVTFGDLGVRQHRGEDSDAAPRWLIEKLQFQAHKNGDIHADKLLVFMEENMADYATWAASSANTKQSGYIVFGTAIASKHIDINQSRRVFMKLKAKLREIETRHIPKLISQEQYDELVAGLKANNLSTANKELVEKLEPIICKRALYLQLPFMRVQINENGIFIYSGTDDLIKHEHLATDADIKYLRQQLMDGEFGYLADEQELRQFILDNIDDYPLIKASPVYTVQPDPGPTWRPSNDPENKHFVV